MLEHHYKNEVLEVGCDEAGRGCLAGPVFAAAVILPKEFNNELLNDSKKLSEKKRMGLRKIIEESAISWCVARVDSDEIDKINILNASILAMHRAIDGLGNKPQHIIVDGNKFKPYQDIEHTCIVKGDGKYMSIAAASILAKTHRDEYMENIDKDFSVYQWKKNKGYPTVVHRDAIRKYGVTVHHRKSFTLLDPQLKLEF